MHLHFERTCNAKCDCAVLSLSWMGKVPDEFPEDEGWKLNRTNYYQEGWLATGNVRGVVGVTFTTSHCKRNFEPPLRANYNLRGHRSEVTLVKWNEPYQKLASCDSSGIIFVWIKYEGRWSIELINDRNTPVTHFAWSHDGRMALICYQDGFVLVGSVAGQRYWSSMLNLDTPIVCGIWTPDDMQVYFGTSGGQVIVMDVHGAMVSQVQLGDDLTPLLTTLSNNGNNNNNGGVGNGGSGITAMAWSCEKFKMEEGDDTSADGTQTTSSQHSYSDGRMSVLAVTFKSGALHLMKSYDDVSPIRVDTQLCGICMEWSNSGELLAIAGSVPQQSNSNPSNNNDNGDSNGGGKTEYVNRIKFYTEGGILLSTVHVDYTLSPVTALTWGHNDKRLFVATGCQIHVAWVSRRVASLQLLARLQIHRVLKCESQVPPLPLPVRIKGILMAHFAQTIRCGVPEPSHLREYVSRPPLGSVRLHCTMIRHDDDSSISPGSCYTLYLEYLGGLVPLLKGKRTSKIRPEFVIFDPQADEKVLLSDSSGDSGKSGSSSCHNGHLTDSSDTDCEDSCASPRMQRRRNQQRRRLMARQQASQQGDGTDGELTYIDTLPESDKLVEVTSNIWGTKFKIHGLASSLPANLGQVTYKTSLLHLQPRQMTLVITELRDDVTPGPDPSFNPNAFSEDEEDTPFVHDGYSSEMYSSETNAANGLYVHHHYYHHPYHFHHHHHHHHHHHVSLTSSPPAGAAAPASPLHSNQNLLSSGNSGSRRRPLHVRSSNSRTAAVAGPYDNGGSPDSIFYDDHDDYPYVDLSSVNPELMYYRFGGGNNGGGNVNGGASSLYEGSGSMRSSSPSPRHALCCDSGLAQSPKHTVAPTSSSEVQVVAAPAIDCGGGNNVQRVKTGLMTRAVIERTDDGIVRSSGTLPLRRSRPAEQSPITAQPPELIPPPVPTHLQPPQPAVVSAAVDQLVRSVSVGFLDLVDADVRRAAASDGGVSTPTTSTSAAHVAAAPRRLVLIDASDKRKTDDDDDDEDDDGEDSRGGAAAAAAALLLSARGGASGGASSGGRGGGGLLKSCGKSKSLDSSDIFGGTVVKSAANIKVPVGDKTRTEQSHRGSSSSSSSATSAMPPLMPSSFNHNTPRPSSSPAPIISAAIQGPQSSPSSPAALRKKSGRKQCSSPIRQLLNSPLLSRRHRRKNSNSNRAADIISSDEEGGAYSSDEFINSRTYRDLETFQKAQLKQKLRKGKSGKYTLHQHPQQPESLLFSDPLSSVGLSTVTGVRRREFVMHNKAPMWNENSQVYQLDFGGRVTQESAKNFQIEFRGKQVMQFGRIDGNAYTLDFQYPFSALQAFAVALANVTQRLK